LRVGDVTWFWTWKTRK